MAGIPSRHRSLFLLAGVIILQVLLLAVQIKRDSQGRLIRVWTVGAVSPFEKGGAYTVGHIRDVWRHYFALRDTARENERLKRENDQLKLQITQLQGRAAEADRLATLLNFRQAHKDVPMLTARVIGASADSASQTIYLDRGERDGIKRNMGVITPDGAVGKVIEAYANTTQVLLLTDKESGVGAMLADSESRWRNGRAVALDEVRPDRRYSERRRFGGHQRQGPHFPAGFARWHGCGIEAGQSLPTDSHSAGGAARAFGGSDRAAFAASARSAKGNGRKRPARACGDNPRFGHGGTRGGAAMNDTFEYRGATAHIEVHKFRSGSIVFVTLVALVIQAFVPVYFAKSAILDLPLLITVYFGLSRRNPSTGLLLGMVIGLLQDSLSGPTVPLGLYGISNTVIGYLASSIGARLDTEHPAARFALTGIFFCVHQGIIVLTRRLLLAQPEPWFTAHLAIAAGINAVAAVVLFMLLDRLRKTP